MERELSNNINMIRATLTFCGNNTSATSGIPAFAVVKGQADTKLVLLDGLNQTAGLPIGGVTTDTNIIRQAMSDISFKVGSAVSAYAASINNNTLRSKVTYTRTDYRDFKKEEVDDICQTIHDEANTHIADAGDFGYDAADVTDLQTAINLYRTSSQNPRQAIITKSQAIDQMKLITRDITGNLFVKQMDKMADTLLLSNPNFHKGYRLAREVINIGVTHAKVRGTVKDNQDVPLIGASFIIRNTGTSTVVAQTLTKAKGVFGISPLPAGDYDFICSLITYQTYLETNVHISAGKEIKRRIALTPIPFLPGPISVSKESDVPAGAILTLDTSDINVIPTTYLTIEISGNPLNISATDTPGDVMGPVIWNVPIGTISKTIFEFAALIGATDQATIIKLQSPGPANSHYKITFHNLGAP